MMKYRKVEKIREGDFLVDLDNGYAYNDPDVSEYGVTVYFHDANGDEGELTVSKGFRLNVERS